MKAGEISAQEFEKLGILLCNSNPELKPVSLTLNDVREYLNALGRSGEVPQDLSQSMLREIRFAWSAEFLDRTLRELERHPRTLELTPY